MVGRCYKHKFRGHGKLIVDTAPCEVASSFSQNTFYGHIIFLTKSGQTVTCQLLFYRLIFRYPFVWNAAVKGDGMGQWRCSVVIREVYGAWKQVLSACIYKYHVSQIFMAKFVQLLSGYISGDTQIMFSRSFIVLNLKSPRDAPVNSPSNMWCTTPNCCLFPESDCLDSYSIFVLCCFYIWVYALHIVVRMSMQGLL